MTKTFTLLLAAGALLCGSATAQAAPRRFGPHAKKAPVVSIDRKSAIDAALRAASQSGVKHLPLKVTVSVPDKEKGGWEVSELREYTYNESGLVATETTTFLTETGALSRRVTYTYDANGSVKSKLEEIKENDDAEWRGSNLEQYSYDEILTDFVTGKDLPSMERQRLVLPLCRQKPRGPQWRGYHHSRHQSECQYTGQIQRSCADGQYRLG